MTDCMIRENQTVNALGTIPGRGRRALLLLLVAASLSPAGVLAQSAATASAELPDAERYRVEGSFGYWRPAARVVLSSDALGVPGTHIDLRSDLGLTSESFSELRLTWHPALRHRFRFQYTPIQFDATAPVPRDLVFNGATYRAGTLVSSSLGWTTYRFGYQYEVVVKPRGRVGVIAEVKHTLVRAELRSSEADEVSRQSMPVPALGIAGRLYPAPRFALAGEVTFFGVPDRADGHFGGRIADIDLSAVWSFTRSFGVQGGFRDLDIHHLGEWNTAEFSLKGGYVAAVFRY
jgi:hypothetical protein